MSEPVACVSTWPIREGQGEGRGFESVFRSVTPPGQRDRRA